MDTLQDSDIPYEILVGCKTPMHVVIRAIVAILLGALVLFITWIVQKNVIEPVLNFPRTLYIVRLCIFGIAVYKRGNHMWKYLEENMRDFTEYKRFKRYFREEMMQKGMTKELAVNDAMEKIDFDRERRRMQQQMRVGVSRRVNNNTSIAVSL